MAILRSRLTRWSMAPPSNHSETINMADWFLESRLWLSEAQKASCQRQCRQTWEKDLSLCLLCGWSEEVHIEGQHWTILAAHRFCLFKLVNCVFSRMSYHAIIWNFESCNIVSFGSHLSWSSKLKCKCNTFLFIWNSERQEEQEACGSKTVCCVFFTRWHFALISASFIRLFFDWK